MPLVKDRTFFKNLFFGQKNRASMQKYLNEMSENGYHLAKIGKFKCIFSEEASRRYIYSLCAEGDETLYALGGEWEHQLTFKDVLFYRKEIPSDAVIIRRSFDKKRVSVELNWLRARLIEGLVLIGRLGNEYIFKRSADYVDYEYHIMRKGGKKPKRKKGKKSKKETVDIFSEVKSMHFVTASDNGDAYYFLKDAKIKSSVIENRGKRLSDQLLALVISTCSALFFCASVLFTLLSCLRANTNGAGILPWLIGGGAASLIFASMFITYFLRFQKIAEVRRIRAEEKRARLEAETKGLTADERPSHTEAGTAGNNNNLVMNTVVLNSYGKKCSRAAQSEYEDDELDPNLKDVMGQVFDSPASSVFNSATNPSISNAKTPEQLARAVMNAAQGQGVQEYEDKTEAEPDDIWQGTGIFGASKSSAPIYEEEWVDTAPDTEYEDEGYEDEEYADENYEDDGEYGFPLLKFIGYAVLCFLCIVAFSLSARFLITWFISENKGNVLTLALSAIGIAFTPFLCYNGFVNCKDILYHSAEELE